MNNVCCTPECQLYELEIGMFFICLKETYFLMRNNTMNGYRCVNVENGEIKMIDKESFVLPLVSFKYEKEGVDL